RCARSSRCAPHRSTARPAELLSIATLCSAPLVDLVFLPSLPALVQAGGEIATVLVGGGQLGVDRPRDLEQSLAEAQGLLGKSVQADGDRLEHVLFHLGLAADKQAELDALAGRHEGITMLAVAQ